MQSAAVTACISRNEACSCLRLPATNRVEVTSAAVRQTTRLYVSPCLLPIPITADDLHSCTTLMNSMKTATKTRRHLSHTETLLRLLPRWDVGTRLLVLQTVATPVPVLPPFGRTELLPPNSRFTRDDTNDSRIE